MRSLRLIQLAIAVLIAVVANASDFVKDNLVYSITSSKTVRLDSYESPYADGSSDYIGVGTGSGTADSKGFNGNASQTTSVGYSVVIPSTVTYNGVEYAVTAIGDKAFYNRYQMEGVTIPASVTSIGDLAFAGCKSLVTVEENNTQPIVIASTVFADVPVESATLYVRRACMQKYAEADVWKDFKTIDTYDVVSVNMITLSENKLEMKPEDEATLTAYVLPLDASNKEVVWSSSAPAVASVNAGKVTAIVPGDAQIRATAADGSEVFAACQVTVSPILIESLELGSSTLDILYGSEHSVTLTTSISPTKATYKQLTWTSDNSNVAVVANGVVTGVSVGSTTIKATATDGSGVYAECVVNVASPFVTDIALEMECDSVPRGESIQINAKVEPSVALNKNLQWTSNNTDVAEVNNGVVYAKREGQVVITASSVDGSNIRKSVNLKVTPIYVSDISMSANGAVLTPETVQKLSIGKVLSLSALASPSNADNRNLTWASSDISVARVDNNGRVTPVSKGRVYITAKSNDSSGKYSFCVIDIE